MSPTLSVIQPLFHFLLPTNCQSAYIVINETASGETVKSIPVLSCRQSPITLDAKSIPLNGSYSYSLVVKRKTGGHKTDGADEIALNQVLIKAYPFKLR